MLNFQVSFFIPNKKSSPVGKPFTMSLHKITGLPYRASMMVMYVCCLHHCAAKINGYIKNQK